ncbi:helix-turn-helix domain-containing protein [Tardiphaga sp. 862_B3_N1_1]|uniref:helix-turn-helix domain-containing protein n=1 Tax=Tardiphaga sp. 862_B3_N1_1 TaxID=3240763 RepID=UPI003F8C6763
MSEAAFDQDRCHQTHVNHEHVLHNESAWPTLCHSGNRKTDIAVTRWRRPENRFLKERSVTPRDRFFVAIALKPTRIELMRGAHTIFDGTMPTGTLYVSGPSKELLAIFHEPFDFIHFHIPAELFFAGDVGNEILPTERLNDLVLLRDPLAEQLARSLDDDGIYAESTFARSVAQTLALYLARCAFSHARSGVLPKWRLKRVEEYVRTHFDQRIRLSDLARVSGLSRMHFAAQFKAATGYRPREYLLLQRVEQAKLLLATTKMPLVEVALTVGFCTQAHFSTVFKRVVRATPARWRSADRETPPQPTSASRELLLQPGA